MESTIRDINSHIKREGIKSFISERMGFMRERILLMESSERNNEVVWVAFEVNGQGYVWDIANDRFMISNSYGGRFFGEDEDI